MASRKNVNALSACALTFLLCSCGNSSAPGTPTPIPPTLPPTPTLSQQIRRAERVGPGFLDYCPLHNGRNKASYQLDLPGGPVVSGWCQTQAQRLAQNDFITFNAFYDARKVTGKAQTYSLTYRVGQRVTIFATPAPILIKQHGPPPP